MSITTLTPTLPHVSSHVPLRTTSVHPLMATTLLRRLKPRPHYHRRFFSISAAVRQDTTLWTQAPLAGVHPAAESLFHVTIDVSDFPDLAASYTRPGQYLQLRLPGVEKPSFLAIASPPCLASSKGVFEFLVKSIAGSTAELLCGLGGGDGVELTPAMGKGFEINQISPPEDYQSVLIFATRFGISSNYLHGQREGCSLPTWPSSYPPVVVNQELQVKKLMHCIRNYQVPLPFIYGHDGSSESNPYLTCWTSIWGFRRTFYVLLLDK